MEDCPTAPCTKSRRRPLEHPLYNPVAKEMGISTLKYTVPRCMGPSHPDTKARTVYGDDDTPL